MKKIIFKIASVIAISVIGFSVSASEAEKKKYFEAIPMAATSASENTIRVYYFFNTNCPSCKKFSPELESWKRKMGRQVDLISVPFAPFEPWKWASKAYLASVELNPALSRHDVESAQESLGLDQVTDLLRAADLVSVATKKSRGKIMTKLSLEKMNSSVKATQEYAESFGVIGTPSLVVIGKHAAYRVSPEFGLTHQGMLNITEALVAYQSSLKIVNSTRD
ncbi:DsbA family protein [Photobacterium galatheae]|uniref:Thioredoxin-like fold domain-containing protein n=1 Tax=Photobacterium galatheae TaxID=1654360 RepID=A0A066RT06_9GAMM|nr:thioredoxin domain-containing protein [Photobacterium galatheae]KDM90822.1 hypothetical protein EA58_13760 [Photobacterium galatheae]MCM0149210.1 thioredoxin domain-containing protein [Photobacterium galatheae]